MINSGLNIINADSLSFKEYFKAIGASPFFVFSTRWKWFKTTFMALSVLCLGAGAVLFVFGAVHELFCEEPDWEKVFSFPIIPFICLVPFGLILSYYQSFIVPVKIRRKIDRFISRHLPEAKVLVKMSLTNYLIDYNGQALEISYLYSPGIDPVKKNRRNLESIVVALYYTTRLDDFSVMDKENRLTETFMHDWTLYKQGKVSCNRISFSPLAIIGVFPLYKINQAYDVRDTVEEMHYLPEKFNLVPMNFVNGALRPTQENTRFVQIL